MTAPRSLDADDYFTRIGQRLMQLRATLPPIFLSSHGPAAESVRNLGRLAPSLPRWSSTYSARAGTGSATRG